MVPRIATKFPGPPSGGLVLWLLASTLVAGSGAAAEPLQLADVFELETVSDPQISPDGSTVVYVRRTPDIMSDAYHSTLWQVSTDGTRHRPLTSGSRSDGSPRWSPSGDRLVYVSAEGGSAQIWVRWSDSGESYALTHLQQAPAGLAWSPDGRWIAFSALVPAAPEPLAELPQKPAGAEWKEPAKVVDRLSYRFDPVGWLPEGQYHLFVVSAEGGMARQVTSGAIDFGGPGFGGGAAPIWTPDGASLLISANHRAEDELEPLDSEIYRVDVESGAFEALTDRRGPDGGVALSPDGQRLAFLGFDDRKQGYQLTNLYVADRRGRGARQMATDLGRSVANVSWHPDGRSLVFSYTSEGRTRLAEVDLDGGVRELAVDLGGGVSAYAGGAPFTLSKDGRFATVVSGVGHPGEIAVGRLGGGGDLRVLTGVNDDLFGQRELGTVEEVWWESSKDGRRVQGWILKPPGFDPETKYPLILEIHGGPFAAYGPKFDMEKQLMAAAGYVVLYTNPRGSTSYGEEFGNLIHHAYPGDDFHDLDSGVDAVLAQGFVDPEQVFVTGGSGGGVLTAWMIGRSERFRAAVSVYPVINWTSWALSADIPAFGVQYWFPGFPWDHAEHYDSRSLLSVVGNVKTPTMVLTGEEDYRTPMSESEQYYTALKLQGVEAVLVRVPDENHGIRRHPSHWASKIAHIIGWMERHRGGA